jgi:hypothetical protein
MAVPFGFSAGDFVSGLGLLKKAVEALRDTDGASAQFQSTILELESIAAVIHKLQLFQATDAVPHIVEKIRFFAHLCDLPLQALLAKLKKLEPELGNQTRFNTGNANTSARGLLIKYGKRPTRQVQWAIQLKKHVSELKVAVGPQLEAIMILLQLVSWYACLGNPKLLLTLVASARLCFMGTLPNFCSPFERSKILFEYTMIASPPL